MSNNYLFTLLLSFFLIGISQKVKALNPFLDIKLVSEKSCSKDFKQKNNRKQEPQSTTKSKTKRKKISFRKKLSVLKLVLKGKSSNKQSNKTRNQKKIKKWNGQYTSGLISWASVLVAIMAFFTSSLLIGILFSLIAVLAFMLAFLGEKMSRTTKVIVWLSLASLLLLFFSIEFPLLTELILLLA